MVMKMALDKELTNAVREAVKAKKQPKKVADFLISLLEEMGTGDLDATEREKGLERLRGLLKL